MTFSYLFQSFRHRTLRHLSLLWIMLGAFLLPLVVSVYRDSLNYGMFLQMHDTSKNQAIHITGAAEEDAELFRGIDELTEPYYEDGTIYLTFKSEEDWKKTQASPPDLHQLRNSRPSLPGRTESLPPSMRQSPKAAGGSICRYTPTMIGTGRRMIPTWMPICRMFCT